MNHENWIKLRNLRADIEVIQNVAEEYPSQVPVLANIEGEWFTGTLDIEWLNGDFHDYSVGDWTPIDERDAMIKALVWNDANGCYTDDDNLREFGEICPTETLRELVQEQFYDE